MRNNASSFSRIALAIVAGLLLLTALAMPPSSRARRESLQPNAQKSKKLDFVPGEILVRFKSETLAKQAAARTSQLSVDGIAVSITIERFEGADIVEGLRIARVAPDFTLAAIEALNKQPDVAYAEPNYLLHADVTPNDPFFGDLYGLTKIGAPTAWNTQTGSANVVVGVIDQGIDLNHQDLNANRFSNPAPGSIPGFAGDVNGYNFVDNNGTVFNGDLNEDHGTHVAGTIGAVGNNSIGVVGVNWTVRLMSLRFLDGSGSGNTADAIRACNYARQMRELFVSSGGTQGANLRILNNSYGGGGFTNSFLDAITALNNAGILFVAAAGNTSDDPEPDNEMIPHYPSSYDVPNVIGVANTNSTDGLNAGSHFGALSVDLGAPGTSIRSTVPGNNYLFFTGTSMSTPHVSGAAALLLAQNPNLTVQQLKNLLLLNGDVAPSLAGKTTTGRRLNVANSLAALAENDVTAPGAVTNLHVNVQNGRTFDIGWNASGDDGAGGQAALYKLTFTDSGTGLTSELKYGVPGFSGAAETATLKIPFRHTTGTLNVRTFDNVGNEAVASLPVSIPVTEGDPYLPVLSAPAALSTGGTRIFGNPSDDDRLQDFALPFSFPFFGTNHTNLTISTNGNLFFSPAPHRTDPLEADDVPSSITELAHHKMISGLWDDIDLRSSSRADAGVYIVQNANRVTFRWQGVPCNFNGSICTGGGPVNFEIELNSDGTIRKRYGSGNTSLFPVVGISGGEPEAYVIASHTSENSPISLTNAQEITYQVRTAAAGVGTIGLYNPAEGIFFLRNTNSTGVADIALGYGPGGAGWLPLAGDWNGDGRDTIGLYNPAEGIFFLRNTNSTGLADVVLGYGPGGAGWLPIAGDWNGDGVDTVGLYNPAEGIFFLKNSNTTGLADVVLGYGPGGAGWLPLAGDWNGDGVDTVGLYNPAEGIFFLRNSNTTGQADVVLGYGPGGAGWRPLVGDWNADGVDTVGLYEPAQGIFFLRNANTTGLADIALGYGPGGAGWLPIAGDWNGL